MRIVALVVALVACVHAGLWALSEKKVSAPDIDGLLASMSYAPFQGATHADQAQTSVAQIRSDMRMLRAIPAQSEPIPRPGGVELVPPIAAEFGVKVTAGAWLDTNTERNEREIRSVIELARRNSNVARPSWSATSDRIRGEIVAARQRDADARRERADRGRPHCLPS